MRNLLITATVFLLSMNMPLYSQDMDSDPFRINCGFAFDFPTYNNASNGYGFYVEPRFNVNENLSLGFKFEDDIIGSGNVNYNSANVTPTRIVPVLMTGNYYFSSGFVRPFIGLGLGMFIMYSNTVSSNIYGNNVNTINTNTNFGFEPQLGLNIYHFIIAAVYNYTGNGTNNYVGIQMGIELGRRGFHRRFY